VALAPALSSIVGWLRAGYPEGVPQRDYLPLFALLANRLSHDELEAVAAELAESSDPASADAIQAAIRDATNIEPNQTDVAELSAHLAAGGWPLAHPTSRNGVMTDDVSARRAV
jgi:Protein of unknown function (DUF3349)